MRAREVWFGVGALALVACGLPEVDLEGEHVRLAIESELTPCGDAMGHMDRFVEVVAAELEVDPPTGDDRFVYHWLRAGDFATRDLCLDGAAGCADGQGTIHSSQFPHDHELVHALATQYGVVPSFFAEGLAVTYELPLPRQFDGDFIPAISITDAIGAREDRHLPYAYYPLAGAFVAYLIERNGLPALRRALARMRYTDGPRRISTLLAAELGASLETLSAEFDALRRDCPSDGFRRKLFECSAPEIAWDGARYAAHRTLDCAQDDVVGPFADATLAHYRTLVVPADARYAVTVLADAVAGERPTEVQLLRCGGCRGHLARTFVAGVAQEVVALPAGRYSLRFTSTVAAATGVGLRLARIEVP